MPTCILHPYTIHLQSNELLGEPLQSKHHVADLVMVVIVTMMVMYTWPTWVSKG